MLKRHISPTAGLAGLLWTTMPATVKSGAYGEGDGMKEDGNGFYTLDDDDELPF